MFEKQKFTKVLQELRRNKTLTSTQKLFISYILDFNDNGLECFQTSKTIADELGLTIDNVRKLIVTLNKLPFFNSNKHSFDSKNLSSKHTLTVNKKELLIFLELSKTVVKKPTELKVIKKTEVNINQELKLQKEREQINSQPVAPVVNQPSIAQQVAKVITEEVTISPRYDINSLPKLKDETGMYYKYKEKVREHIYHYRHQNLDKIGVENLTKKFLIQLDKDYKSEIEPIKHKDYLQYVDKISDEYQKLKAKEIA